MINQDDALEVALAAAMEAGEILRSFQGELAQRPAFKEDQTWTKSSGRDLATAADLAAERAIVARLRAAFPEVPIEAEEETSDAKGSGPRWFVDPLDGTTNFIHGLPIWCVSIALYIDEQPEVAVIYLPMLDETFHAACGQGAFLNGLRIHVSEPVGLSESVLATGFPYRRGELEHNNLANFNELFLDIRGIRRMGSAAVDLAYTAAGRLDGFWELHLSPFDLAAGVLLVREAGGIISDADGGTDWLRGGHILAAGPVIHQCLLGRVKY